MRHCCCLSDCCSALVCYIASGIYHERRASLLLSKSERRYLTKHPASSCRALAFAVTLPSDKEYIVSLLSWLQCRHRVFRISICDQKFLLPYLDLLRVLEELLLKFVRNVVLDQDISIVRGVVFPRKIVSFKSLWKEVTDLNSDIRRAAGFDSKLILCSSTS